MKAEFKIQTRKPLFNFVFLIMAFLLVPISASIWGTDTTHNDFVRWCVISKIPPKIKIASSKKKLVKEGITLQNLVNLIGSGWVAPDEGAGVIKWFFDDESTLCVWPERYNLDEVLTFDRNKGARMWWNHSSWTQIIVK